MTTRTIGEEIERIRQESADERQKGDWFARLVMKVLPQLPQYEIAEVYEWGDWVERKSLTLMNRQDHGIDLVARTKNGEWVPIQCKCYAPDHRVSWGEVSTFLALCQIDEFKQSINGEAGMRWVVSTSPLTSTAAEEFNHIADVRQIDFMEHGNLVLHEKEQIERAPRQPWPLQERAIEQVVSKFGHYERGRLVMACGTGKTFTALRIAEQILPPPPPILAMHKAVACFLPLASRSFPKHGVSGSPMQLTRCVPSLSAPTHRRVGGMRTRTSARTSWSVQ